MTEPTGPVEPYLPYAQPQTALRTLYRSIAQVYRLSAVMDRGSADLSWQPVTDTLDPWLGLPGQLMCRVDLQFVRRGIDQPMPVIAGRSPDRIGVMFCDPAYDASGKPLLKAGDRFAMVAGPVTGNFEVRVVPDVAIDFVGAHHLEFQVIEVAEALGAGSFTPFPGGGPS